LDYDNSFSFRETLLVGRQEGHTACKEVSGGVVICLERHVDLHMAQLMPLPLAVSCCSKIQIGFTFLVPAHLGSPGKRVVKRVCVSALGNGVNCLSVFITVVWSETRWLAGLMTSTSEDQRVI